MTQELFDKVRVNAVFWGYFRILNGFSVSSSLGVVLSSAGVYMWFVCVCVPIQFGSLVQEMTQGQDNERLRGQLRPALLLSARKCHWTDTSVNREIVL